MAASKAAGTAGGPTKHTPNTDLVFEDAVRPATNALIALTGPSSSGKTRSALAMATGMGTKIGVCDTERGRASHYAGLFPFKHLRMPDYAPQTLVKALAVGAAQGIDVMIIDSGSHFWSGKSGILDQVDNKTEQSRSKNAFTSGWKSIKPVEHEMWDAIMAYPGHVIMTLRVKTAYELVENQQGKKEPTKIGLKPDQRESVEYEFDIVGDMDMSHTLTVSKCSFPGLWYPGQRIELPNTEHGADIVKWLSEGARQPSVRDYVERVMDPAMTYEQLVALYRGEVSQRGLLGAAMFDPETGEQTTLGGLIVRVGTERRLAAEQPAQTHPVVQQGPAQAPTGEASPAVPELTAEHIRGEAEAAWLDPEALQKILTKAQVADLADQPARLDQPDGPSIGHVIGQQIEALKAAGPANTGTSGAVRAAARRRRDAL